MRVAYVIAGVVFLGAVSAPVDAAEMTPAEEAFFEGRELMEEESYDEACEAFSRAFDLDPAPGTLLNLALCQESVGNLATAHATYLEAAELAASEDDETREQAGLEAAEELEPRVPRLNLELEGDIFDGLEVTKGDENITDKLGESHPVDPGDYELAASAPGRLPWEERVDVAEEGETVSITIPVLEKEVDVARRHREQGAELYRDGDFEDAIEEWQHSYELNPEPYLLFDIANAYRELGEAEEALSHFRKYLEEDPDGEVADQADRRIEEIEAERSAVPDELADRRGRDADAGPEAEPDAGRSRPLRTAGMWSLGAGATVTAVGLGYRRVPGAQVPGAEDRSASAGNALVGVGVVAGVAGLILLASAASEPEESPNTKSSARLLPAASPERVGITIEGAF